MFYHHHHHHLDKENGISLSSTPGTKKVSFDEDDFTSDSIRIWKRRVCSDSENNDFTSNSINKKQKTKVMGPSVAKSSKISSTDVSISNDVVDSTSAGNEGMADGPLHVADCSSIIPPPQILTPLVGWISCLCLSPLIEQSLQ